MSQIETHCANCGLSLEHRHGYIVTGPEGYTLVTCSRLCTVAAFAPEISRAIVLAQWIAAPRWVPTQEEEERMRQ